MILNCGIVTIVCIIQKFLKNFFHLLKNEVSFFFSKLLNTIYF